MIASVSKPYFAFRSIAGRVSLHNDSLTLEGLAGEKGTAQYIIRGPLLGSGLNVLVDGRNNTIRLGYLKSRIRSAAKKFRRQNVRIR